MKNQLAGLMKQAQAMQDNLKRAQEELARVEVEGHAGAGLVKVTMTWLSLGKTSKSSISRKSRFSPPPSQSTAGETATLSPGAACVHFPPPTCQRCVQRAACTTARRRSIAIHPQEALLQTLRARQQTTEGRAHLRQRTAVEHALARVQQVHGPRARYKGVRKNTLDVRRCAAVANLEQLRRLKTAA